jgi:EAL domain-containing protein (putative c-di-GMP-specific phosphodiesterase class I)
MTSSVSTPAETPTRAEVVAVLDDPGGVSLVYQPIVDLARGVVVGYETLSRFAGARRVGPDVWFRAAAQHGLHGDLTSNVLRRALAARAGMPADCFLTVNLEPQALLDPTVARALDSAGDLGGVFLELTEHEDLADETAMLAALARLRERGAMIAIDDAGSGYSGLRQILTIRPQLLKLDRSLVRGIPHDQAKVALIEMLGDLAGRLDAWLLAEGIEEAGELLTLSRLRVPLGQGYYLGKPAPPWTPLTSAARDTMSSVIYLERDEPAVGGIVEPCALAISDDEAAPSDAPLARVDDAGRLIWLQFRVGPTIVRRSGIEVLRVRPDASPAVVAQRLAARPASHRLDVVACADDAGRFLGCIRVERLLDVLGAASAQTQPLRRRNTRRTSLH